MPTTQFTQSKSDLRPRLLTMGAPVLVFFVIAILVGFPRPGVHLSPIQEIPITKRTMMPDFNFPTLAGKHWKLANHRGQVVLLNFWATWCPPCRAETPGLVELSKEYTATGLQIVGISMDNSSVSNVNDFVSQYQIPYSILLPSPESSMIAAIQAYPTTILIDRKGRIASVNVGELNIATLKPVLDKLLAEPLSNNLPTQQ